MPRRPFKYYAKRYAVVRVSPSVLETMRAYLKTEFATVRKDRPTTERELVDVAVLTHIDRLVKARARGNARSRERRANES